MEVAVLNELISNVGFPIAVCIALFWHNRETIKHYERVILRFEQSIDKNTEVMNNLITTVNRVK